MHTLLRLRLVSTTLQIYQSLHHTDPLASLILRLTLKDGFPEAILGEHQIVLTEITAHSETETRHWELSGSCHPAIEVCWQVRQGITTT
jgi:hypothetical protein